MSLESEDIGGVERRGWCVCIDAKSAKVSIDGVEDVRGKVGTEPVGTGDIRGEEWEGCCDGLRICAGMDDGGRIERASEVGGGGLPELLRWTWLCGDCAGVGGLDRGLSLGERSELMSMLPVALRESN